MSEIKKILIAYDGSECADYAIEDLRRAGLPDKLEAVVLTIADAWALSDMVDGSSPRSGRYNPPNLEAIEKHLAEATEQAQALADAGAERVREMFPEWDVKSKGGIGKPAWEIIKKAEELQIDLVIIGSQGRTALGRIFLGSVSQRVLNEAHCSVRIARKALNEEGSPLRILIAFDGSECAELAVKKVISRRWAENTEFRVVTADDDVFSRPETGILDLVPEGKQDSEEAKAWVERVLEAPVRDLKSAGLNVSQTIELGEARQIVLWTAEEWRADAIFMGARGMSRFKRFLLGSISAGVAARAKCSVEIVRGKITE
jgi:nucleotide-binding universal stress UspA family protein